MQLRILLADDHPFIRRGVRETLLETFSSVAVEEATDGREALRLLTSRHFDLAIIDVAMPDMDGFEVMREALASKPDLRFLVMSVYSEHMFAERAYRGGARGYLSKVSAPGELVEAARRILAGNLYVSADFAESLVQALNDDSGHETQLSDRELDVLRMIAAGESLKEIGAKLHLSAKTVSTYKTRTMEKLGIATNAELIAWAIEQGIAAPLAPPPVL